MKSESGAHLGLFGRDSLTAVAPGLKARNKSAEAFSAWDRSSFLKDGFKEWEDSAWGGVNETE